MAYSRNRWSRSTSSANTGLNTVDSVLFNGPAIFTYGTADDNAAAVGAADYFKTEAEDLAVGDVIIADCSDPATKIFRVATVTRGAPSVQALTVTVVV